MIDVESTLQMSTKLMEVRDFRCSLFAVSRVTSFQDASGVDLTLLSLFYRLDNLERSWRSLVTSRVEWRLLAEPIAMHWMRILRKHALLFVTSFINRDEVRKFMHVHVTMYQ